MVNSKGIITEISEIKLLNMCTTDYEVTTKVNNYLKKGWEVVGINNYKIMIQKKVSLDRSIVLTLELIKDYLICNKEKDKEFYLEKIKVYINTINEFDKDSCELLLKLSNLIECANIGDSLLKEELIKFKDYLL